MRILVVYYSLTGNIKLLAEAIAAELGADLQELRPLKDQRPGGIGKYFWGGGQVIMKELPELYPLEKNPVDYDLVIIGTPVWAWTFAPTLRAFFAQTKLVGKKVALFCSSGGSSGKTLADMRAALPSNEFVGEIEFVEPIRKSAESVARVREWARGLMNKN